MDGVWRSQPTKAFYSNSRYPEQFPRVFLLDTDVGQPERSPPGCVSLFEIESPLIGIPFTAAHPHSLSITLSQLKALPSLPRKQPSTRACSSARSAPTAASSGISSARRCCYPPTSGWRTAPTGGVCYLLTRVAGSRVGTHLSQDPFSSLYLHNPALYRPGEGTNHGDDQVHQPHHTHQLGSVGDGELQTASRFGHRHDTIDLRSEPPERGVSLAIWTRSLSLD